MSENDGIRNKPGKRKPKANLPTDAASSALRLATIEGKPVKDRKAAIRPTTQRVTAKQEEFARHVASGLTLSASYRLAYDAGGMADETIHQAACRLAANSKVNDMIKAEKQKRDAVTLHDPAEVKAEIVQTLRSILSDSSAKSSDRMKAAELLGRWGEVALFEEHSTVKVETVAPEQAIDALKERIAKLKAS